MIVARQRTCRARILARESTLFGIVSPNNAQRRHSPDTGPGCPTYVIAGVHLIHDDAADALALVHQVERLGDVGKRHGVGDHRVDFDLFLHVPIDDLRHVGAAAGAAEGGAAPDPAGDQLERPGGDLLARASDADDDALAPAAMAALQRHAHEMDVADAFESVVGAADLI